MQLRLDFFFLQFWCGLAAICCFVIFLFIVVVVVLGTHIGTWCNNQPNNAADLDGVICTGDCYCWEASFLVGWKHLHPWSFCLSCACLSDQGTKWWGKCNHACFWEAWLLLLLLLFWSIRYLGEGMMLRYCCCFQRAWGCVHIFIDVGVVGNATHRGHWWMALWCSWRGEPLVVVAPVDIVVPVLLWLFVVLLFVLYILSVGWICVINEVVAAASSVTMVVTFLAVFLWQYNHGQFLWCVLVNFSCFFVSVINSSNVKPPGGDGGLGIVSLGSQQGCVIGSECDDPAIGKIAWASVMFWYHATINQNGAWGYRE